MELTVQKDTYTREECLALRTLRDVLEDTLKGAQEALQAVRGNAAAEVAACMPVHGKIHHNTYHVQCATYSMRHTLYERTAQAQMTITTVLDDVCCTLHAARCNSAASWHAMLPPHVITCLPMPHSFRLRRALTSTRAWGQSTTHWCSTTQRSWYAPAHVSPACHKHHVLM
jgi:hypothetical protein